MESGFQPNTAPILTDGHTTCASKSNVKCNAIFCFTLLLYNSPVIKEDAKILVK